MAADYDFSVLNLPSDLPASGNSKDWRISPENQRRRDKAANALREVEGSPTLEEDRYNFTKAQQKNQSDPKYAEALWRTGKPQPEYDFSALKQDLSKPDYDFSAIASSFGSALDDLSASAVGKMQEIRKDVLDSVAHEADEGTKKALAEKGTKSTFDYTTDVLAGMGTGLVTGGLSFPVGVVEGIVNAVQGKDPDDRPISTKMRKFLTETIIGAKPDNQAFAGGEQAVGAVFTGPIETVGKHAGPIAKLGVETVLAVAGGRGAYKHIKEKMAEPVPTPKYEEAINQAINTEDFSGTSKASSIGDWADDVVPDESLWSKYVEGYKERKPEYLAFGKTLNETIAAKRQVGENFTIKDWADVINTHDILPQSKILMNRIRDAAPDTPIKFFDYETHPQFKGKENVAGEYWPEKKLITINTRLANSPHEMLHTINHESTHAAHSAFFDTQGHTPLARAAFDLYAHVKDNFDHKSGDMPYGLKNHEEFFAELSNPNFIDYLHKQKVDSSFIEQHGKTLGLSKANSLWTVMTRIFSRMFNLNPKETSALSVALQTYSKLAEHLKKDTVKKYNDQFDTQVKSARTTKHVEQGNVKKPPIAEGPKDNSAIRDHLYRLLTNAKDLPEFMRSLKLVSDDPVWKERVVDRAAELWEKKDTILKKYGESSYSKLDSTGKRDASDIRPFDQMLREEKLAFNDGEIVPALKASDDISMSSRLLNVAVFMGSQKMHKGATKVIKNIIGNVEEYTNVGRKLFKDMVAELEPFGKLKRDSQKKVIEVAVQFDGILNQSLKSLGLQWPTAKMLMQRGLNEAEVHAYQAITRAVDKSYNVLDSALKALDLEPLERIPGYFPHYWVGSYKVKGLLKMPNGAVIPFMRAFDTKYGAKRFENRIAKEGALQIEYEPPTAHVKENNIASVMYDTLMTYRANNALDAQVMKQVSDVLMRVDMYAKRGIIREALERGGMHGHEGEMGFGHSRAQDDRLIEAYEKHIEATAQFWTNTMISRDVLQPFVKAQQKGMFQNTPNLVSTVHEYIGRANGQPVNHAGLWTQAWRAGAIKMGLPPDIAGQSVQVLSSYMTFVRLRLPNVGYWGANVVQPVFNMNSLIKYDTERAVKGEKQGSMLKAMNEGMKQFSLLNNVKAMDPDVRAAVQWAWNNNKIDVYQTDHLNPLKNTSQIQKSKDLLIDLVPRNIEEHGRTSSFITHYAYDRQVMPKEEALRSAANKMNKDMGDYQNMSSAAMYTDFGGIGQALRPFALLRNVYFGKLVDTIQLIGETAKREGVLSTKTAKSTNAMTSLLGMYLLVAGAEGMFGITELDLIVRLVNQYMNPDQHWRRPGQVLREWGLPDSAIYGVLGDALGINIGPSIAAPGLAEVGTLPFTAPLQAGATILNEGRKAVTPGENPDVQKVIKSGIEMMPNMMKPHFEAQIAEKHDGILPETTTFHGNIERTDTEFNKYAWTGKMATSEVNKRRDNSIIEGKEKANKAWKSDIVQKIVDAEEGFGGNIDDLMISAFEKNRGFDAETLMKALKAERVKRFQTKETRRLLEIMETKNTAQKAMRLEIMQRLERE